jgi:chromosome segregation ATPase
MDNKEKPLTLQECKEKFAKKQGYTSWVDLLKNHSIRLIEVAFDTIAIEHASQQTEALQAEIEKQQLQIHILLQQIESVNKNAEGAQNVNSLFVKEKSELESDKEALQKRVREQNASYNALDDIFHKELHKSESLQKEAERLKEALIKINKDLKDYPNRTRRGHIENLIDEALNP